MLLQAAEDFNIDLSQSYMIGDGWRDVEAGKAAGCKDSILIEANKDEALLAAVDIILKS